MVYISNKVLVAAAGAWLAWSFSSGHHWVSYYQVHAAIAGVWKLFHLPQEDIDACVAAYQYLQAGTTEVGGNATDTDEETEHIRRYYKVLQPLLSIADIEKMYIPPQLDPKQGLYGNQLLHEKMVHSRAHMTQAASH